MWFPSCLQAGLWLKSVGLIQRSVAVRQVWLPHPRTLTTIPTCFEAEVFDGENAFPVAQPPNTESEGLDCVEFNAPPDTV